MPQKTWTGAEIRQSFIDYFVQKQGHTFVPSTSLVPGGDATLLFTNAGMVQFKDVFLGTDQRPYTRAANSQKCMRVAGKHNDLDDVGRDDTHHTFFEMLGNWSFGDYYKKEAITWAWELLTEVWGLDKTKLYATCFQDDKGDIPRDDEAAENWRKQPGFDPQHVRFFGRKENFWEMAETGPCGPCSEIHIDRGPEYCNKQDVPGHVCAVNGDCTRYLELWNLVFIQYNRTGPDSLEPLPATHVDTGAGLDRVVSVMQNQRSNYKTDMFMPLMRAVQALTGHDDAQLEANLTPYRVIADHARASSFLIADGVVPGNTGRNYICRMIIRRAARFASKIGLHEPFLARVAAVVIDNYGVFYPELLQNRTAILDNLTREEQRFQRTVESGMARLEQIFSQMRKSGQTILDGEQAFDLYATYGLPLEITKDVALEHNLGVDEAGFRSAMEQHRLASGSGAFAAMGGESVEVYRDLLGQLQASGKLAEDGVAYDPYNTLEVEGPVLAMVSQGEIIAQALEGQEVEVLLPETCFYIESGGQVTDTGTIVSVEEPRWEIAISGVSRPAAGVIVHRGKVVHGSPKSGNAAIARVDSQRRRDIMRNHTATHLLHAALHEVLGEHARQAGSLVAPDRLRFDFTHPEGLSREQVDRIERIVNLNVLNAYDLNITYKPLAQAKAEGAMALFGEKYADIVRTITIGTPEPFSYELCGGTHVANTSDIGLFVITTEGSAAAGIRRIEAVTGRGAYELARQRSLLLRQSAELLSSAVDQVPAKVEALQDELAEMRKKMQHLRQSAAMSGFLSNLETPQRVDGVNLVVSRLAEADADTLRSLADAFRQRYPQNGVAVLASVTDGKPALIVAVTQDLTGRGIDAVQLVRAIAAPLGGGGGGKPTLAQAGGKDAAALDESLASAAGWIASRLS